MPPSSRSEINRAVRSIIERFNTPVPRYTSYPTVVEWGSFEENVFFTELGKLHPEKGIALYIHLPFCENLCLYCGCNVLVSRKKNMATEYINVLLQEIDQKLIRIPHRPTIKQLHFGGGTPNYLELPDWHRLMDRLRSRFEFEIDSEISIEMDPMVLSPDYLREIRALGFNRVSYGLQDINSETLEVVDRPQDQDHLEQILSLSRKLNFNSINADFIYGLPFQTVESYQSNLSFILKHRPDRLALFSYAHVPWLKHHQKRMPEDSFPEADEKLSIYLEARSQLLDANYVQIGMDHFALPEDSLTQALAEKNLHRNFMGYSTHANLDMLAFGTSAIAKVGRVYAQNHSKLKAYKQGIADDLDHFEKGFIMSDDDMMRSDAIQSLMGSFYLNIPEWEINWNKNFENVFSNELRYLEEFSQEGFLELSNDEISVTELGTFIVRHIAKTFDAYRKMGKEAFSKGI